MEAILARYPPDEELTELLRADFEGSYAARTAECFDAKMVRGTKVLSAALLPGDSGAYVVYSLSLSRSFSNVLGNVHGGFLATAGDILMSFAITAEELGRTKTTRLSVSVALTCEYMNPLKAQGMAYVVCHARKSSGRILHSDCQIYSSDGVLCTQGRLIKAMVKSKV